MKKLLIFILLPLFMASCDFKNPVELLKPDEEKLHKEWKPKTKETVYRKQVINWWPDKYVELTDDELRSLIDAPPPDPRYEIKEWLTLLAKIATGIGLLGMLVAAVLFVYSNPAWDDVAIVSFVAFSGGLTVAISYSLIVIVIPLLTLCAVVYFGYIIYQKHKKQKTADQLLDVTDVFTELFDVEESDALSLLEKAGILTKDTKKHAQLSVKRRNGTREKDLAMAREKIKAAIAGA